MQRLAEGPATLDELAEEIQDNKVLTLNRGRIITTWGDDSSPRKTRKIYREWDAVSAARLAEDILDRLGDPRLELVMAAEGKWELTEKFSPYERYVLVTLAGKPLTHLRLRERETRAGRAKLAEARALLVDAARLTCEAGVNSAITEELFKGLQRMLSDDKIFEDRPRGSSPRPITPDQPPDLENLFIPCVKCEKPKPQHRDYYEVYWSQGAWRWRKDCKECRNAAKRARDGLRHKPYLTHIPQVQQIIGDFIAETGYPPTVRQAARRAGIHANAVRAAWRDLALSKKDFPPLPEALTPSHH